MRKILFLFLIIIIGIYNVSAISQYNVSGYVLDETGSAFSGATVSFSGGSNVSDEGGYWIIHNVINGTYTFTATKTGFGSDSVNVTVSGSDVASINFTLSSISNAAIYAKLEEIEKKIQEDNSMIEFGYVLILISLWGIVLALKKLRIAQTINALSYTTVYLLFLIGILSIVSVNIVLMLNFLFLSMIFIVHSYDSG